MAGEATEVESQETDRDDSCFVWDDATQLYFHATSGFYHDPNAGWYYSSRDGFYYKFENGNYVLLQYNDKVNEREAHVGAGSDNPPMQDESSSHVIPDANENSSPMGDDADVNRRGGVASNECTQGNTECANVKLPECEPPPSEWLEETLINFFLSGYNHASDGQTPSEVHADNDNHEVEEGNCITEDQDASREEENWRAQYGQVVHSGEEPGPSFHFVDLWDWRMVTGSQKDGKDSEARLVGRLVKRSAKLHPSLPSSGGLIRTAPICEVDLDLVRVRTGQVYKLRSPSARYLASFSSYDSSNPTKDWKFPELSISAPYIKAKSGESKSAHGDDDGRDASKKRIHPYRDRAAERRTLHGGFGVGHGQKSSLVADVDDSSSTSREEAAAEALNMSFGAGSYARKLLKGMGWKEGQALGNTTKGLLEPLEAVGNTVSAGLGGKHIGGCTDTVKLYRKGELEPLLLEANAKNPQG